MYITDRVSEEPSCTDVRLDVDLPAGSHTKVVGGGNVPGDLVHQLALEAEREDKQMKQPVVGPFPTQIIAG